MLQNLKSAFKSTLTYGLGNLSIKLAGFVLLPLYTKCLSVSDYGILALLESLSQILVAVFGFNLTSALFRWYWDSEYSDKRKSIVFTTIVFSTCVAIFVVVAMLPLTPLISKFLFGRDELAGLLKLMLMFSAIEIVIAIPAGLMRLQERAVLYAGTTIVRLAISLVATVYLLTYFRQTVDSIYLAQLMGSVLYLTLLMPYLLKNVEIRFEGTVLKEMLAFSTPLVIGTMSTITVSFADRYILKFFGVLGDVGIYSLGFKIANTILFVVMSIQLALTPLIYKSIDQPEGRRFLSKILTYFSLFIMLLVVVLSLFGYEFTKILARDPDYWPAFNIVPIVALAVFVGMVKDTTAIGLTITRKTRQIAAITTLMSVFNLLLDLLLIPRMQIIGAAVANLMAQVMFLILIYRSSQKAYFIPYEVSKITKIVVVGICLFAIGGLTNGLSLSMRLPVKSVLLVLYPIVLFKINVFEDIELVRLREVWNKWKHVSHWNSYVREF